MVTGCFSSETAVSLLMGPQTMVARIELPCLTIVFQERHSAITCLRLSCQHTKESSN